jgi:hypothetical protein
MEFAFALVDAGGGTRAGPEHQPLFIGLEKEREIYTKMGSDGFAFIISSDTNPQRREYWSSRYRANLLFFANASIRLARRPYWNKSISRCNSGIVEGIHTAASIGILIASLARRASRAICHILLCLIFQIARGTPAAIAPNTGPMIE